MFMNFLFDNVFPIIFGLIIGVLLGFLVLCPLDSHEKNININTYSDTLNHNVCYYINDENRLSVSCVHEPHAPIYIHTTLVPHPD